MSERNRAEEEALTRSSDNADMNKPHPNFYSALNRYLYRSSKPLTRSASKQSTGDTSGQSSGDVDADAKPLPSFNGALESFAFTPGKRTTRSSSKPSTPITPLVSTPRRTPRAVTTPVRKRSSSSSSFSSALSDAPSSVALTPPPSSKKQPRKKKPKHKGYAPPSQYSHLPHLPQTTEPGLILLFVGTNPGLATAATAYAYASPSNLFWRLLYSSGLTPDRKLHPSEHITLPEKYSLGNTNLVARPTKDQAELSKEEMEASTVSLEERIRGCKPEAVAVVGKGVWERIYKHKTGQNMKPKEFKFGWQGDWRLGADPEKGYEGARVFVTVSTSGLVAGYSPKQKAEIFRELGEWVQKRRKEKGEEAPRKVDEETSKEAVARRLLGWRRGEMKRVREEGGDVEGVEETIGNVLAHYGVMVPVEERVKAEEVEDRAQGASKAEAVEGTGDIPVKEEGA